MIAFADEGDMDSVLARLRELAQHMQQRRLFKPKA